MTVGKLNFKVLFFFVLCSLFSILFDVRTTHALVSDESVLINEVMFYPSSETTGEFIELYNNGSVAVDLSRYYIKDNLSRDDFQLYSQKDFGQKEGFLLDPEKYALILDPNYVDVYDELIVQNICDDCLILTVDNSSLGNGLSKEGDKVELYKEDNPDQLMDSFIWEKVDSSWIDFSQERNLDNKQGKSFQKLGTPVFENSIAHINQPLKPQLISPQDDSTFLEGDSITFEYLQEVGVDYLVNISKSPSMSEPSTIEDIETFEMGTYYWQVFASNYLYNGEDAVISEIRKFNIVEPVYSKNISIRELMPNPTGADSNEWIELFNDSNEAINLDGWFLEDLKGSIKRYEINDTVIAPYDYLLIYRNISGITLNNDSDGVRLLWPNGKIAYETKLFSTGGEEGWTWAKVKGSPWQWTAKPTPEKQNVIFFAV